MNMPHKCLMLSDNFQNTIKTSAPPFSMVCLNTVLSHLDTATPSHRQSDSEFRLLITDHIA